MFCLINHKRKFMRLYKYAAAVFLCLCFISNFAFSTVTSDEIKKHIYDCNDYEVIKKIINECWLDNIIETAMQEKDLSTIICFVENGLDINKRFNDKNLLEMAIEQNELHLVDYFLSKGADPFSEHWSQYSQWITVIKTPIYDAINLNRIEIVKLLGDYGYDFNAFCYQKTNGLSGEAVVLTPIQLAVSQRYSEIAKYLISIGVEI